MSSTQDTVLSQPAYFLPSTVQERERLDAQHRFFHRALGNIHVHVPLNLEQSGLVVLDSGAGSGAWLLDIAKITPSDAELIGIDIQPKLFPPPEILPANITFQVGSIVELPEEWTNKFALVNQRLLVAALRYSEWNAAIKNMYRVLKPGGWVQLVENIGWVNQAPMLEIYTRLWQNMLKAKGIEGTWPKGADLWKKMVEDAGFVDIRVERYDTPVGKWAGADGEYVKNNIIGLLSGMKELVVQNDGFSVVAGGEEGYERWLEGLAEEMDSEEVKPELEHVLICARKPVEPRD